jgi:hypothetical protein
LTELRELDVAKLSFLASFVKFISSKFRKLDVKTMTLLPYKILRFVPAVPSLDVSVELHACNSWVPDFLESDSEELIWVPIVGIS